MIGDVDATSGTVTAHLMGLPPSMSVAVVYNPNMAATLSTDTADVTASASLSATKGLYATLRTWGAAKYCVLYNAQDSLVTDAYNEYKNSNPTATIDAMLDDTVVAGAIAAQNAYVAAGFRQAALIIKSEDKYPCGGTTPRFFIHYARAGSSFNPTTASFFGTYLPVIGSDGNYYGSLYISPNRQNLTTADTLGPVEASVAHEMFHAIQFGYDIITWSITAQGHIEGAASTYGRSIALSDVASPVDPVARPGSDQIFKLSNFLTQNSADLNTRVDSIAYSNQDFFAFVGRAYAGGDLAYLEDLFQQISDDIDAAAGLLPTMFYQPTRVLLFTAMDTVFQSTFNGGESLAEIYIDFVKQRAMEHDADSQLHSGEPTTSGTFNSDLFDAQATNGGVGMVDVSIDPLSVSGQSFTFGSVAPFAARAVVITPSQSVGTGGTGATLTVTVSGADDGAVYVDGVYQDLSASNVFTDFGASAADKIVILLARTEITDSLADIDVTVSGTNGTQGETGGYVSTFEIDSWSVTGVDQLDPGSVVLVPDVAEAGILQPLIFSASSTDPMLYSSPYITIQFRYQNISGPGTYNNGTDDDSDVYILYGDISNAIGYDAVSGTTTFTAFGTEMGDHITGSLMADLADTSDSENPVSKGSFSATFDLVVGSFNDL
ncbi:MAG: hypothetical protein HQM16_10735 [Deltaproteobacteria bacterium]|nr:hypothetical protein [Deltaproteobacteria bacterium]